MNRAAVVVEGACLLEGRAPSRTCSEGGGHSGRRRKGTSQVPCKEWKAAPAILHGKGLRHGLSCLEVLGRVRTDGVAGQAQMPP